MQSGNDFMVVFMSALGGAIGGLIGFMLALGLGWWRKPHLKIDLENIESSKPYIHSLRIDQPNVVIVPHEQRFGLFFRLVIRNIGRSPAMNCEAKVIVFIFRGGIPRRQPWSGQLHWAIRDPLIYKNPDQIFAPVHLNPKSPEEALDVLQLDYKKVSDSSGKDIERHTEGLYIYSTRPYPLLPNQTYLIEVNVSANNTLAEPFRFEFRWSGDYENFRSGEGIKVLSK